MSVLAKVLIALFGGAVCAGILYIIVGLLRDLHSITHEAARANGKLTPWSRDHIAASVTRYMRLYNESMGRYAIEENPPLYYLCGVEMALIYMGVRRDFHTDETGKYASLTLDGVDYDVTFSDKPETDAAKEAQA